jgi:hypothetical protein
MFRQELAEPRLVRGMDPAAPVQQPEHQTPQAFQAPFRETTRFGSRKRTRIDWP